MTIEHRPLPVSLLTESTTNPRKQFDAQALQDLADSIRAQGLLQPITVRPHPRLTGFEVVFGHRRFRACQLAGMDEVPCIIRPMSDEQVLMAQIVENLARADVHPVEEAEAFRQLLDRHHKSADDIATQVGKSRTYVYNRLKLSTLTREARDECMRLGIGGEIATLIARVPPALQLKAVARCWRKDYGSDTPVTLSYRDARQALQHAFTQDLRDAVFPIADARLLPAAGPCTACDKCSSNDIALHADLGTDVCTDTECWDAKEAAHRERRIEDAKARGLWLGPFDGSVHKSLRTLLLWPRETGDGVIDIHDALQMARDAGATVPPVHLAEAINDEVVDVITAAEAQQLQQWLRAHLALPASEGTPPSTAAQAPGTWPRDETEDEDDGDTGPEATVMRFAAWPRDETEDEDEDDTGPEATVMQWGVWPVIRAAIMRRAQHAQRTADELRHVLQFIVTDQCGELGEGTEQLMGLGDSDGSEAALRAAIATWSPDQLAAALVLWSIEQGVHPNAAARLALCQRYGVDPLNPTADPTADPTAAPDATPERDPRVPDMFAGAA